ncbi:hypothetical protein O988_08683 [Pseudogymnoascus sp. VKM F-3808]|nr:hypothetical protein O988_08683 [Pseudogymnoascus sp. VKM F-3808]
MNWGVRPAFSAAAPPITRVAYASIILRSENSMTELSRQKKRKYKERAGYIRGKKAENRIGVVDSPQLTPSKALLGKAVNYGFDVQARFGDLDGQNLVAPLLKN